MILMRGFPKSVIYSFGIHAMFFLLTYVFGVQKSEEMTKTHLDIVVVELPVPVVIGKTTKGIGVKKGAKKNNKILKKSRFGNLGSLISSAQRFENNFQTRVVQPNKKGSLKNTAESLKRGLQKDKKTISSALSQMISRFRGAYGGVSWGSFEMSDEDGEGEVITIAKDRIQKELSKFSNSFRDCYERALLIDPDLNGYSNLFLSLGKTGKVGKAEVTFKGKGTSSGKQQLGGCLQKTSRRMHFPRVLQGRKLKFGLNLRS